MRNGRPDAEYPSMSDLSYVHDTRRKLLVLSRLCSFPAARENQAFLGCFSLAEAFSVAANAMTCRW